jgi:uncharacterized membrane protein
MRIPRWLLYALAVPLLWGAWGALTELPEKWITPHFPATLGYAVWSLTMVPVALYALSRVGWKLELDARSIFYGCLVGLTGASGQLLLFWVLAKGPAYIIFPIVCLSPALLIRPVIYATSIGISRLTRHGKNRFARFAGCGIERAAA